MVSARSGFTLVEMAIATVLVTILSGLFLMTTRAASGAVNTGVAVAELDSEVQRVLERVCEALKATSSGVVTPQAVAPFAALTVDLQRGLGADAAGVPQWGPVERFVLEYDEADDGVDDDGDGLVDEGRLVWLENPGGAGERRVVLCNNVREYAFRETFDGADENANGLIDERGFALDYADQRVTVRLTLVARDEDGAVFASTAERTIAFRNEGA